MHGATSAARSGRRPGSPDTRSAILAAARELFAARGLKGTTIRAVAADAGVDPALVHHYFGTKQDLFLAAADLPVDPGSALRALRAVPLDGLGEALVQTVLGLWGPDTGPALLARFRTSLTTDGGGEIGDILMAAPFRVLSGRLQQEAGITTDEAGLRAALAISAVAGLVVERHLLGLSPLATTSVDVLVAAVGPTVQAHIDGRTTGGEPLEDGRGV